MKESDIKFDDKVNMWYICTPLGVCMYFRRKEDAIRTMDEFHPPAEHKPFKVHDKKKLLQIEEPEPCGMSRK